MNQGTVSAAPERHLRAVPNLGPAGCTTPWCIIDHTDPVFSEDCHIADTDWTSGLGLSLSTADGAPVTVEITWDVVAHIEDLRWSPEQARQVAALLLELADAAEGANGAEDANGAAR